MRSNLVTVPIAAFAIALGSFSAEAQERGDRRSRGSQNQGQERSRSDASARQGGGSRADRGGPSGARRNPESQAQNQDRQRSDSSIQRGDGQVNRGGRNGDPAPRRDYDQGRSGDRHQSYGGGSGNRGGYGYNRSYDGGYRGDSGYSGGSGYSRGSSYGYNRGYDYNRGYGGGYGGGYGYSRNYYAPRPLPWRSAPRHYYGSGGHFSLYFGFGSGYLYGSEYSGRVYGYRGAVPSNRGNQYYGDVLLQVNPRDAAVYVDGYYAGIVDDFDGSSQRLALEAGPHKIEIAASDAEPQVFDVYVDPSRTVELRADLQSYRR